jgi:hypothetical protein
MKSAAAGAATYVISERYTWYPNTYGYCNVALASRLAGCAYTTIGNDCPGRLDVEVGNGNGGCVGRRAQTARID